MATDYDEPLSDQEKVSFMMCYFFCNFSLTEYLLFINHLTFCISGENCD